MSENVPVIQIEQLSKRFVIQKNKSVKERLVNARRSQRFREDFWALRNISLEIEAGTTVALIGSNGSGKSTLLKSIGGIIQPTTGSIRRRGRLAALLELGAGFHQDLTGRENVYLNASILGLSKRETDERFDQIVEFSGIGDFIDTQVKFYSSGMYVRLAFAVAIHIDPDLLLVDEVLAVGDEAFQKKCLDKIRAFQREGRTIVIVTHSLSQVQELCSRAILLDHGAIVTDGPPTEVIGRFRQLQADGSDTPSAPRIAFGAALRAAGTTGPVLELMPAGADVDIEIAATGPDLAGLHLGFEITTPDGHTVLATDTGRLGRPACGDATDASARFTLRDLRLGGGTYLVNGTLTAADGDVVATGQGIAPFRVQTDGRSSGSSFARVETAA